MPFAMPGSMSVVAAASPTFSHQIGNWELPGVPVNTKVGRMLPFPDTLKTCICLMIGAPSMNAALISVVAANTRAIANVGEGWRHCPAGCPARYSCAPLYGAYGPPAILGILFLHLVDGI